MLLAFLAGLLNGVVVFLLEAMNHARQSFRQPAGDARYPHPF